MTSCESVYVGRTTRQFQKRIEEHVPRQLLVYLTGKSDVTTVRKKRAWTRKGGAKCPNNLTAVGQHLKDHPDCARSFNLSQFSVLARARSEFHLNVLEAIFIQSLDPILCRQKEFVYSTILYKGHFDLKC